MIEEPFGREWRLQRAKNVVLEYMRGVKQRTTLNWCIGCLLGNHGLKKPEEIRAVIERIENDPTIIMTSERKERLEKLKKALKGRGIL